MKKAENLSIQKMNTHEMKNINGGFEFLSALAVGTIVAVVSEILDDWDNFENGFRGDPYVKKS